MINLTIQRRVKTFHPTKQTGHQQRIKRRKKAKKKMDRVIMTNMVIVSNRMKASMKKAKSRTVMEKRVKKHKNSMKKVKEKPKNKTMETKKISNKKTMVKRASSKIMVMNSTD